MKVLKNLFIFAIGACAGASVAYYYTKDKYEKQNKEEQESLLAHYGINRTEEYEKDKELSERNLNKPSITEYSSMINRLNYTSYSNKKDNDVKDDEKLPEVKTVNNTVEIIDLDEFNSIDEYDVITIAFYADGVLATYDDEHEVVDERTYIGQYNLDTIFDGSAYGDCVYIRNHDLKLDIELVKDAESFADVMSSIYG